MKTSTEFVAFLREKAIQKPPYLYGTFGRVCTPETIAQKRRQYPHMVTADRAARALKTHVGKATADCIGLHKWFLWQEPGGKVGYNPAQDVSANGMRSLCRTGGPMSTFPHVPGAAVFMNGHIGYYAGAGQVVEERGFDYGTVVTPLAARPWTSWGLLPWIDYGGAPAQERPEQRPVEGLQAGDRVRLKAGAMRYYPGGASVPEWVRGTALHIGQTAYGGAPVIKSGLPCVLLKEINTWVAISNLEKVEA